MCGKAVKWGFVAKTRVLLVSETAVEGVSLLGKANKRLLGDCSFLDLSNGLKYAARKKIV